MQQVQNLLNEVNSKIQSLETAKSLYSEQLAPDFQVFDFVNTSENGLSWIIANLLNPKGTHGQKTLFLEQFIRICLPNIQNNTVWQNYLENLTQTEVETEATTWANRAYRRMDIYLSARINSETFGICIENKPYANDQENQLADYFLELENRKLSQKHLVYLCEYGEPSNYSVTKDVLESWIKNQLISFVTYSQLVVWLTECKKDCQNHSVTEFLNQFIKFIQKQFMGVDDMNEQEMILNSMLQDQQTITSSIKISLNIFEMKRRLITKLLNELKLISNNKSYTVEAGNLTGNNKYESILFKIPNNELYISIEFQGTWFNMPALCIMVNDKEKINIEERKLVFEAIRNEIRNKKIASSDKYYAWYSMDINDWWSETKPWEMIQNGDMAKMIIAEVDKNFKVLTDYNFIRKEF
ncbi:PD-(D/E)XK nuclease family protein [Moraxella sp. CTOTU49803]|uniref:PDDEXK-like family protein n=1 Tax=Moraxella sp. CTOTU49803 TaxID=2953840 RepID=UPI0028A77218|nr:PD-(D/E)XK nuclease family protein [Moraxella sp. CTOTU49803]